MKNSTPHTSTGVSLRHRANALLRTCPLKAEPATINAENRKLVHELQIHQIELELQNAELRQARSEGEEALARITELYDFAPVAYFTVDSHGFIRETNLTGSTLLGVPREKLPGRRLHEFLDEKSIPKLNALLRTVRTATRPQGCEALLHCDANHPRWLGIQASIAPSRSDTRSRLCRLAIADITCRKEQAQALEQVRELSTENRAARREIARRKTAERRLIESEKKQRELLVQSRRLHLQLRLLMNQFLLAQEEDRKCISRELHDDIAQVLAAINVRLSTLLLPPRPPPEALRPQVLKLTKMISGAVETVHAFAARLRPPLLDDLGLVPALRSLLRELGEDGRVKFRFITGPKLEGLDNTVSTVLYRVAREALVNVLRHADAHCVSMRLHKLTKTLRLEIRDDGKAFDVEATLSSKSKHHLGLLGMRERVEMLGGRFTITSLTGAGTVVCAELPDSIAPSAALGR